MESQMDSPRKACGFPQRTDLRPALRVHSLPTPGAYGWKPLRAFHTAPCRVASAARFIAKIFPTLRNRPRRNSYTTRWDAGERDPHRSLDRTAGHRRHQSHPQRRQLPRGRPGRQCPLQGPDLPSQGQQPHGRSLLPPRRARRPVRRHPRLLPGPRRHLGGIGLQLLQQPPRPARTLCEPRAQDRLLKPCAPTPRGCEKQTSGSEARASNPDVVTQDLNRPRLAPPAGAAPGPTGALLAAGDQADDVEPSRSAGGGGCEVGRRKGI